MSFVWFPCSCTTPPCECKAIVIGRTVDGFNYLEATIYSISVSGLSNDSCSYCSTWNGDFDLCWQPEGTWTWESPASTTANCGHTSGDPLWRMTNPNTGFVVLEAVGLGYQWKLPFGSWVYGHANTLTLASPSPVPAPCTNVPATITMTPCVIPCEFCDADMPDTVPVTLSGAVSDYCDCSFLNQTFILDRYDQCTWYLEGVTTCNHATHIDWSILYRLRRNSWDGHLNASLVVYAQTHLPFYAIEWRYAYDFGAASTIDCTASYYIPYSWGWFPPYRSVCRLDHVAVARIN